MRFGQFASTTQFYLYGRKYCTKKGYDSARKALLKQGPDPLDSACRRHTYDSQYRLASACVS